LKEDQTQGSRYIVIPELTKAIPPPFNPYTQDQITPMALIAIPYKKIIQQWNTRVHLYQRELR